MTKERRRTPRRVEDKLFAEWFWTDRWTGSSAFGLPQEARGIYREMLTQAWRRECRLPNDHEQIRRITGTTLKEWNRSWLKVKPYWRVDGEFLVNDTQLEVYADCKSRSSSAKARAQAGAQAMHEQRLRKAQADAQDMLSVSVSVSDATKPH